MKTKVHFKQKVEILPNKRIVVSPKRLLNLIEQKPREIEKIKFINPKLGSKSLGKFVVEYEW